MAPCSSIGTMHHDALVPVRDPAVPRAFCWTRFGTEAGETIEAILTRKDLERQTNSGVFLWGIGNSIAPALVELVRRVREPKVLFSPIRGRPRKGDVEPLGVVQWMDAEGLRGDAFDLPVNTHVTSRWDPARSRSAHYALVCSSPVPLQVGNGGSLSFGSLRNLRSGAPLGASQVTAVVQRVDADLGGARYPIAFRAALIAPYFLRLRTPRRLDYALSSRSARRQVQAER
jgi:hypothetical protein